MFAYSTGRFVRYTFQAAWWRCDESAGVTGVVWRVRHPFDHLWCGNSLNTQSKTRCTRFACKSLFPRWSYWYVVSGGAGACGFLVPLQTVVVKHEYFKILKPRKLRSFSNVVFQVIKFGYPLFFLGFKPHGLFKFWGV